MTDRKTEDFQPFAHVPPDTLGRRLAFRARLLADFQVRTVQADVLKLLSSASGRLLDVGCGASPYRHLVDDRRFEYTGVDIQDAAKFGYERPNVVPYDGKHLPFETASFDAILCTEVLEHVEQPAVLVGEMHRVLKPGAVALVTVPWSARYHYVPWDFHRFTPTALEHMFKAFASAEIIPRGTDLTAIASKILVACMRGAAPGGGDLGRKVKDVAVALSLAPLAVPAVLMGHASLAAGLGSTDDPLGYSIFLTR
jgi:SAM-dependent methyltransferase